MEDTQNLVLMLQNIDEFPWQEETDSVSGRNVFCVARIYHPVLDALYCDARITVTPCRDGAIDTRYPIHLVY